MSLSHFNKKNKNIEMVDISKKNKTKRFAEARSLIEIDKKLYSVIKGDKELKNNLFNTAKIAGIYAAKNTSYQIPLTHNIPIDYVSLSLNLRDEEYIEIINKMLLNLTGKKILVTGIAYNRSIAWGIAQQLSKAGAELGIT